MNYLASSPNHAEAAAVALSHAIWTVTPVQGGSEAAQGGLLCDRQKPRSGGVFYFGSRGRPFRITLRRSLRRGFLTPSAKPYPRSLGSSLNRASRWRCPHSLRRH